MHYRRYVLVVHSVHPVLYFPRNELFYREALWVAVAEGKAKEAQA